MSTQPEALRLADELEMWTLGEPAAAELRRLHAENEAMRNVANRGGHIAVAMSRIADLESQRDALLEALKDATKTIEHLGYPLAAIERARAAIKAVEETK